jgi:hypothetical protein
VKKSRENTFVFTNGMIELILFVEPDPSKRRGRTLREMTLFELNVAKAKRAMNNRATTVCSRYRRFLCTRASAGGTIGSVSISKSSRCL